MGFSSGNIAVIKIDASEGGSLLDISQYVSKVSMSPERDKQELPRLGGNAKARLVGAVTTVYKLEGWYDPTLDEVFESAMSATTPVTRTYEYGPAGTDTGARKYTGECYVSSYEVETAGEDPASWTAELEVDGANTQGTY